MKLVWLMAGLLVGAAVGGLVALFFVPRSGEATRGQVKEQIEFALEQGKHAAEVRQRELENVFKAMKQPQRS